MPLRCLIFSSREVSVQPIWQVLADLGVEGEYCQNAVDAVERVTTHLFQIVITDWDDQPEAAFLLKTARDLKAAQRPLTLAIVSDEARPEALKAGANSVLLKPLRAEQVRDTIGTACQLLHTKQQPAATPAVPDWPQVSMAAAAASAPAPVRVPQAAPPLTPASVPASVTQRPESLFRAGEFLQSGGPAPGAQFATEDKETEVAEKSVEQAGAEKVEALTELEPMAAAVQETPEEPAPEQPVTGWAALQSRLTKTAQPPPKEASANQLLSYEQTPSLGMEKAPLNAEKSSAQQDPHSEVSTQIAAENPEFVERPRRKIGRLPLVGVVLAACTVAAIVPRARLGLQDIFHNAVRAGASWLNPPPAAVPQAAPQHDSFGQSGDEYKLPNIPNIPDPTTDPSQIRVVPVIDPTAKPDKGAAANGGETQTEPNDSSGTVQDQSSPNQASVNQGEASLPDGAGSPATDTSADAPKSGAMPDATAAVPTPATAPEDQSERAKPRSSANPAQVSAPAQVKTPVHTNSAGSSAGIPSSLRSQIAAVGPAAGGNKPPEAAMSTIEPVLLPEAAARELLAQTVEAEYPAAARASALRGSVALQVVIGRDGVVQDAKFLSGSLMFARAGINAVKQWRFKPYFMNGRAVSVQSVMTLNFKPPA